VCADEVIKILTPPSRKQKFPLEFPGSSLEPCTLMVGTKPHLDSLISRLSTSEAELQSAVFIPFKIWSFHREIINLVISYY
jgi:hypothetical protein